MLGRQEMMRACHGLSSPPSGSVEKSGRTRPNLLVCNRGVDGLGLASALHSHMAL